MSMIEPDGHTIGPEPAAPAEPRAEAILDTPTEADTAVVADSTPEEPDTFDRKYVEGLRDEAARYRTRSKDYEQTFGEMPEDIRAGWLELINMANSGDPEAITALGQALGFVPEQPEVEQYAPDEQFLTREEAAQIARDEAMRVNQEAMSQRDQEESIRGVASEAKDLGYRQDTPEYIELLYFANNLDTESLAPGESILAAADRQVKEYRQEQYAKFIASKEEEARTTPATVTGNGVAPNLPRQAFDSNASTNDKWAQVRDSLHERLSNIPR